MGRISIDQDRFESIEMYPAGLAQPHRSPRFLLGQTLAVPRSSGPIELGPRPQESTGDPDRDQKGDSDNGPEEVPRQAGHVRRLGGEGAGRKREGTDVRSGVVERGPEREPQAVA